MPGLTRKAIRRTNAAVRRVERKARSQVGTRRPTFGGGSGRKCSQSIRILVMGAPTGGNLIIPVTVNAVTADVTIGIPATVAQIQTAFETHAEIEEDDFTFASASGGATGLPGFEIKITGPVSDLELGEIDNDGASDMTGGAHRPYVIVRRCCG